MNPLTTKILRSALWECTDHGDSEIDIRGLRNLNITGDSPTITLLGDTQTNLSLLVGDNGMRIAVTPSSTTIYNVNEGSATALMGFGTFPAQVYLYNLPVGTGDAVSVDVDGLVYKAASSLRYKTVVSALEDLDITILKDLLNAYRAVEFRWKSMPEGPSTVGAIVEYFLEALTLEEARTFATTYLIIYNEENLPDNFNDYAWKAVHAMIFRYLLNTL